MAQCNANNLISEACLSGFTCRSVPEQLAILNQLLCNFAASGGGGGGGGALTPYTKTQFVAPALPFTFVATRRTHIDVAYEFITFGVGNGALLNFARTGFANMQAAIYDLDTGGPVDYQGLAHFDLSPGDTFQITDGGDPGASVVTLVAVLEE